MLSHQDQSFISHQSIILAQLETTELFSSSNFPCQPAVDLRAKTA
jgi:hypothetical protein